MRLFLGLNEGTSGDERQKAPRVGFDLLSRTGDQPNWMNQAHKARVFYSNWAHKENEQIYLHQMLCVIAFQMCDFFPPFAAGDKIIQIGEGGGKKYIFVVSTLQHSLQRLHPLQLAKQTTSISANLLFFHAWDCRVVTGWRVKVRSELREARWIKSDCQLCCTRQMSGIPAMFFLPQTPFLTNLHSLPVSFLLSPSFWFMSACSCTHKSLDSEKSSCNASLRNLGCASSCLATQHRSDLNGGHKSGLLNMIT